jgi:redox-sensing transcriptional repressor
MNKDRPKSSQPADPSAAPKATIGRLSLYLRHIDHLLNAGEETISSNKLGEALDISDAQVRKDLGYFGPMGHPGVGYRISQLRDKLRLVLGTNRDWNVALIGIGNLGRALLGYGGFQRRGFVITALFDQDPQVVGTVHGNLTVHPISELSSLTRELGLQLAILAVPTHAANEVAARVQSAGIVGVLNFAPTRLTVPKDLHVVSVDLGSELERLAFEVNRRLIPIDEDTSVPPIE